MALLLKDATDLLIVKFKNRHDSVSDQYNRMLMAKLLLLSSFAVVLDVNQISCMVPAFKGYHRGMENFVADACWIKGLYVYKELGNSSQPISYYGIPKDLSMDGFDKKQHLCQTKNSFGDRNKNCEPLKRIFFQQYQWYYFFLAALCFGYYIPYLLFKSSTSDLVSIPFILLQTDKLLYSKTCPKRTFSKAYTWLKWAKILASAVF